MKILVKKFYLAHEGRIYKAGEVVEVADAGLAKQLLARADGDLEAYRGQAADIADSAPDDEATQNATDEEPDEEPGAADSDNDGAELPAFDPAAAVQAGKGKTRGKAK